VTTWGTAGNGPGQFNLVHCVVVDAEGRVYVADRSNRRIQVFDANGRYLEEWASRRPNHMLITQDRFLWLADGAANRFAKYDLEGTLLTYWGTRGSFPGAISNPHAFSVDSDGNLYVVDYLNNRLQKFTPKRDAEPSRLMVQPPR
jgi:sugar lactone lactonase YvrE